MSHRLDCTGKAAGDYFAQVAAGQILNTDYEIKFGNNPAVGAAEVGIWEPNIPFVWPDAAEQLSIVSDSTDDTDQGAGAWTVHIHGLDVNWKLIEETVTLNGTTPVLTQKQFLRTFRMYTTTAASRSGAVGTILATQAVSGGIQAQTTNGNNQTLQAAYTVPAGMAVFIHGITSSCGRGEAITLRAWTKDNKIPNSCQRMRREWTVYQSNETSLFPIPYVMDELTDLWVTGQRAAAGVAIDVDVEWYMTLRDRGHVPRVQQPVE